MTTYTPVVAEQAAEENYVLRANAKLLQEEDDHNKTLQESYNATTIDTTVVDGLKDKNRELRERIKEQERQLAELKSINVTELYHDYSRLDNKRAHLRNENAGLRNILANQRRDVKKATKAVNAQQQVRRQNEEQNASMTSDAQMFLDKREKLMKEAKKLSREEVRLQGELTSMPAHSKDVEAGIKKLEENNAVSDRQIHELEAEMRAEEMKGHTNEHIFLGEEESRQDDVARLREEYVHLKEQLKSARK